ncbi:MAG: choline-sulfatase [Pseudohongiellaceae bacterium]|jgi:choline-sulfatase
MGRSFASGLRFVGTWGLLAFALAACGDDAPTVSPVLGGGVPEPASSDAIAGDFSGCNLVLISLDTLRSDALATYGADPGLGERLDRFAKEAVVFEHARSQAPQTAPSHMSLFTGMYPSVHGVQNVQHKLDTETGRREALIESVPESLPLLAEVLSAGGYATVALTDGGNLNPPHGFARGFDEFTKDLSGVEAQVADGLKHLSELRTSEQPFFLFWHTYEIHAPYVSPRSYMDLWSDESYDGELREIVDGLDGLEFRQRFAAMRTTFWANKAEFGPPEADYLKDLYEAGVDYTDQEIGALLDALDTPEARQDTIVVILADHGEEFAEHGQWQHDQVYEECLRVPLMIRLPGGVGAGQRVQTPVALIDVMPTVLELLQVDRSALPDRTVAPMQGLSLVPTLLTGVEPRNRPIYSEYRADRKGGPLFDWQVAVYFNDYKLIYNEHRSNREKGVENLMLFNVKDDPDERQRLGSTEPRVLKGMTDSRDEYLKQIELFQGLVGEGRAAELDEATRKDLEALGYLH